MTIRNILILAGSAAFFGCATSKKLEMANGELVRLREANSVLQAKNSQLDEELISLKTSSQSAIEKFVSYKSDCEQTRRQLTEMENDLEEVRTTMDKISVRIEDAMGNFMEKGVRVYKKDGLLYVSLEDDLLYKTGSAKLDPKGEKALAALASALNDYPLLQVLVIGNTDSVQFKKGGSNWTLSTERANGVVRMLRDKYSVDPSRLVSAGRGKYAPVADNSTSEGRARNRRTDIVLNPDFKRLWESIHEEGTTGSTGNTGSR
jgi:chemotaxis protein MotB